MGLATAFFELSRNSARTSPSVSSTTGERPYWTVFTTTTSATLMVLMTYWDRHSQFPSPSWMLLALTSAQLFHYLSQTAVGLFGCQMRTRFSASVLLTFHVRSETCSLIGTKKLSGMVLPSEPYCGKLPSMTSLRSVPFFLL